MGQVETNVDMGGRVNETALEERAVIEVVEVRRGRPVSPFLGHSTFSLNGYGPVGH